MQKDVVVILSCLTLLALCYLALWKYKDYRLDSFRQSIFAIRDELFDEALDGLIAFDHPAYIYLRGMMNNMIRFAHQLSLWQMVFISIVHWNRKDLLTADTKWDELTKDLSQEVRDKLKKYNDRMDESAFYYLIGGSPEFFPLLAISLLIIATEIFCYRFKNGFKEKLNSHSIDQVMFRHLKPRMHDLDDAAFLYGKHCRH